MNFFHAFFDFQIQILCNIFSWPWSANTISYFLLELFFHKHQISASILRYLIKIVSSRKNWPVGNHLCKDTTYTPHVHRFCVALKNGYCHCQLDEVVCEKNEKPWPQLSTLNPLWKISWEFFVFTQHILFRSTNRPFQQKNVKYDYFGTYFIMIDKTYFMTFLTAVEKCREKIKRYLSVLSTVNFSIKHDDYICSRKVMFSQRSILRNSFYLLSSFWVYEDGNINFYLLRATEKLDF